MGGHGKVTQPLASVVCTSVKRAASRSSSSGWFCPTRSGHKKNESFGLWAQHCTCASGKGRVWSPAAAWTTSTHKEISATVAGVAVDVVVVFEVMVAAAAAAPLASSGNSSNHTTCSITLVSLRREGWRKEDDMMIWEGKMERFLECCAGQEDYEKESVVSVMSTSYRPHMCDGVSNC